MTKENMRETIDYKMMIGLINNTISTAKTISSSNKRNIFVATKLKPIVCGVCTEQISVLTALAAINTIENIDDKFLIFSGMCCTLWSLLKYNKH